MVDSCVKCGSIIKGYEEVLRIDLDSTDNTTIRYEICSECGYKEGDELKDGKDIARSADRDGGPRSREVKVVGES